MSNRVRVAKAYGRDNKILETVEEPTCDSPCSHCKAAVNWIAVGERDAYLIWIWLRESVPDHTFRALHQRFIDHHVG